LHRTAGSYIRVNNAIWEVGPSLRVAEGDDLEVRRERSEMVTCRRVGAEADDAKGAAVKIIGADDDLGLPVRNLLHLIAPFAHRLDRTLTASAPLFIGRTLWERVGAAISS